MTALRTAAQQALEALESADVDPHSSDAVYKAITALRAALAEPVQEPVAWQERQARRMRDGVVTEWTDWYPCRYRTLDEARSEASDHIPYEWRPLYTAPPQRPAEPATIADWWAGKKRKPLSEDEIKKLLIESAGMTVQFSDVDLRLARAIERAHGIK